MNEPDFVQPLTSGAETIDEFATPHPLLIEDVERQMREMEWARAAAEVSSHDYLIT